MSIRKTGIFLGVLSVFLYGYTLPGVELNLFIGVIILTLGATTMSLSSGPLLAQRGVLIGLVVILAVGAVGILLDRGSMGSYLTQAFAISLVVLCSVVIVSGGGALAAKIFPTYLELSFVFALVAMIELVLGILGIYFEFLTPKIDYAFLNMHRISGLAMEPSHYCFVMTPSVVAILISALLGRPCMPAGKALIIVASYILTFSSVGIFMLSLILFAFLFRRSSVSSAAAKAVLAIGVIGAFAVIPQINTRVMDTYNVFVSNEYANVNLSSLTLYKNFLVSLNSVVDQPLFGAGLGGHEYNYFKYLPDNLTVQGLNLNEKDANSLLLRLVSEFGLPFTVAFYLITLLVWTGFPDRNDPSPIFWKKLTSTAILGLIVANSLRSGNYIIHGFPFFLVLYYSVYRSLKDGDIALTALRTTESVPKPL